MARESSKENNEPEEITLEYPLTISKEHLGQVLLKYVKFK